MMEKINWQKELFKSKRFSDQLSKGLLENGSKNFSNFIY